MVRVCSFADAVLANKNKGAAKSVNLLLCDRMLYEFEICTYDDFAVITIINTR